MSETPKDQGPSSPSPSPSPSAASPMPLADNEVAGSGASSPNLPLTMSASVVLADLPRDATAALEAAGSFKTDKIVVRFKPVGSAPLLAQDVCKISATRRFEEVVRYLRKKLRCKETDSVFLVLTGFDIVAIRLDGSQTLAPDITVLLDKLGEESSRREVSNHVDLHKDLTRGTVTSTNTDRGNRELLGDERGHLGRNSFNNHGKAASFLKSKGILEDAHSTATCLALDAEATKSVLSLRGQTDMAKNGNTSSGDFLDGGSHLLSTLKLDTLNTTFLDKTDGSRKSLVRAYLICTHGQVADLAGGSRNRPAVQQHLLHDNFTCVFHTKGNHGKTITDKNDVHACMIGNMATGEIMSCHDSDGITLAVHGAKGSDSDLLALGSRRRTHGRV
ncbi:hypothetical protein HG531_008661 [Fusarium graminearum]|nr:hypothetical protein HG531_008661 [Fusarium graminearum]